MIESLPQSGPAGAPERSFGRIARSVAGYGLVTTVMAISPLVVFVPTALFHCALRNGRRAAWIAASIAMALGVAYMFQATTVAPAAASTVHLAWASFLAVALGVVIPALLILPLVERGDSFGRVVAIGVLLGVVGLLATEAGVKEFTGSSPLAMQVEQAKLTATSLTDFYRSNNAPAELVSRMRDWMGYGMVVLPAWIIIDIAVVFILSLMMLGRLRVWRDYVTSRGEAPKWAVWQFRTFELPDWVLFGFVFGGLTPITTGLLQKVAANVLAVVVFLYLLQGLAVFRGVLIKAGVGLFGTLAGLLVLAILVFMGAGLLLLAIAGLFDPFFHFRNFKRKDESHESHSD